MPHGLSIVEERLLVHLCFLVVVPVVSNGSHCHSENVRVGPSRPISTQAGDSDFYAGVGIWDRLGYRTFFLIIIIS